jgi:hypothetical protein
VKMQVSCALGISSCRRRTGPRRTTKTTPRRVKARPASGMRWACSFASTHILRPASRAAPALSASVVTLNSWASRSRPVFAEERLEHRVHAHDGNPQMTASASIERVVPVVEASRCSAAPFHVQILDEAAWRGPTASSRRWWRSLLGQVGHLSLSLRRSSGQNVHPRTKQEIHERYFFDPAQRSSSQPEATRS